MPTHPTPRAAGGPATIDEYIASAPPMVRGALRRIRAIVRAAAPGAEELISYRMPAFRQGRILVYFAAFKHHIGLFPPVRGDAKLVQAAAPYAGPAGNLKFPLEKPLPLALLRRIVAHRVRQERARAPRRGAKTRGSPRRPARARAARRKR